MYNSRKGCAKFGTHADEPNWRKNLAAGKNRINVVDGAEKPNRHLARQQRRHKKTA